MIKHLQKKGTSRGIVLNKSELDLLGIDAGCSFEIIPQDCGLFLKPVTGKTAYKQAAVKHRKSLDKLTD